MTEIRLKRGLITRFLDKMPSSNQQIWPEEDIQEKHRLTPKTGEES